METHHIFIIPKVLIDNSIVSTDEDENIRADEDPGLPIETFAVLNIRGVSANSYYIFVPHAKLQTT